MLGDDAGRTLKTTRTSLRVLELVIEHDGLTLAELDGLVDKPKSSLHSHLRTLVENRYLVYEENTYRASFRLAALGERVRSQHPVASVVVDAVEDLADQTGQEANFTLFEHGRLLLVHGASGRANDADDVGFRTEYYLHNTAAGKAILAELEREHVERIVDEWGLARDTEATITDRDELLAELDETAERGYGFVEGETAPGLVAVGVSVQDPDGSIVGALSVGGPKHRLDVPRLHREVVDKLFETADALERELVG